MSRTKQNSDFAHIIVRRDHVLCTVCGCVEAVSTGDGTPLPTYQIALEMVCGRHPRNKHENPFKK